MDSQKKNAGKRLADELTELKNKLTALESQRESSAHRSQSPSAQMIHSDESIPDTQIDPQAQPNDDDTEVTVQE